MSAVAADEGGNAPNQEQQHYDVAIIGAGMSGLAAGIRLAHFGKRVCLFERHNAIGGLNSFYSLGGRKYDVGLHAVTNFVRPGVKGTPLTKLLRQLRIDREEFALCEQRQSRVSFGPSGEHTLKFSNDLALLESEVAREFPAQIDGFRALVAAVRRYDDVSLDAPQVSAREIVGRHITDPLLTDMLFCPVMYYGSASAGDMDFGQFAIMFKALFFEGFARPLDGVRVILRVLLGKYRAAGGQRRMKCGVRKIICRGGRAAALLLDSGEEVTATHVLSSAGAPETFAMIENEAGGEGERGGADRRPGQALAASATPLARAGGHSFVETITVLEEQPDELGWGEDTIVFFNDSERFHYGCPEAQVDVRSGVICFPNNFAYPDGQNLSEGFVRLTCLANPQRWFGLPEERYRADKQRWFTEIEKSARRFLPPLGAGSLAERAVATDMFTPRTIHKYTGHANGAIYGSPEKIRSGRTPLANLYLCGTDQGFLGIIGAMLSGISMANFHILQGSRS
ncbi:phytoene dehydrogenase [Cephaloticoccus primus]|uniref:Phytoene dehydrogenase n=1 Tax=Cephaloticoccus primus TaxID=1548207 RepID=A0A139SMV8_9BACT|nr:FAD-dependent oxidoreductase [Cephaloticoccus primus]KXU35824.1 phytoene dehydrogenase [Cephaloticoccus primus]